MFGVHAKTNAAVWLVPIGVQFIFPIIIVAGSMFLPESPRWLIAQGQEDGECLFSERPMQSDPSRFEPPTPSAKQCSILTSLQRLTRSFAVSAVPKRGRNRFAPRSKRSLQLTTTSFATNLQAGRSSSEERICDALSSPSACNVCSKDRAFPSWSFAFSILSLA